MQPGGASGQGRGSGEGKVVYIVTHNQHKFAEASAVLREFGIELRQIRAKKLEVQDEDVVNVARVAAEDAYGRFRVPLIVDDSGLYIDYLKGFPGPYSSYVLEKIGLNGVLRLLEGASCRRACFRTGLAYADGSRVVTFVGEVCGSIAYEPRGSGGFGYDPIFVPEGYDKTFAEMDMESKNRLSHRGSALRKFAAWYLSVT